MIWRLFWEEFVTWFRAGVVLAIVVQPLASELVSVLGCQTLNDMISSAQGRETELEHLQKRGSY